MLLTFVVVFFIATFPATWLLMLFLGNLRTHLSYWGALPLGILVSALLGGVSAQRLAGLSVERPSERAASVRGWLRPGRSRRSRPPGSPPDRSAARPTIQ